jgi:hypothetical protein
MEKQQHRKGTEAINMVIKTNSGYPMAIKELSTANKGHTVSKLINRSVGRRRNMDTCQTVSMNKPVGSRWVNIVKQSKGENKA